jgi:hypothetical protein
VFNSSILDVAIGLVFCFAGVSLFASSIVEGMAAILNLRHRTLLDGIKELLNNTDYVQALYRHALINPLHPTSGGADQNDLPTGQQIPAEAPLPKKKPAYIPSDQFAHALTDLIAGVPGNINALNTQINGIKDPQLKTLFQSFAQRAGRDVTEFETQVARWFDNAMDRLSGKYKRWNQLYTFLAGLAIAGVLNIDSIHVFSELWQRPALASAITSPNGDVLIRRYAARGDTQSATASQASAASQPGADTANAKTADAEATESAKNSPDDVLGMLMTLPVGWSKGDRKTMTVPRLHWQTWASELDPWFHCSWPHIWPHFLGWLITASAAVFGAPFWFDLLQRLIQVRGTGTKPLTARERNMRNVKPTRAP